MRLRAPRRVASAFAVSLSAVALAACTSFLPPQATQPGPVQGQGTLTTEDRTSGEFQHLSVGGGIRVVVASGSPVSVTLAAQANLLPLISTSVVGGQLVVNVAPPGLSSTQPVTLTVMAPDLRSLTLSGGATGTLQLMGTDLSLDVSGGAQLEATGRVRTLKLTASSGAQARLGGFIVDSATVTMSDGGQAELSVANDLAGTASGGASIRLIQKPATVSVSTSGGAIVQGG